MSFITLFTAGLAAFAPLASAYTQPKGDPSGNAIYEPGLNSIVPVGKPFSITWEPTTEGKISLVLLHGPSTNVVPIATIAESIDNSGSYSWTPSTSLAPNNTYYGIELIVEGTGQYQYSTQFGISNPDYSSSSSSSASFTTTPSVNIKGPMASETASGTGASASLASASSSAHSKASSASAAGTGTAAMAMSAATSSAANASSTGSSAASNLSSSASSAAGHLSTSTKSGSSSASRTGSATSSGSAAAQTGAAVKVGAGFGSLVLAAGVVALVL